jgi:hypothetical protein
MLVLKDAAISAVRFGFYVLPIAGKLTHTNGLREISQIMKD